jgi:hypothetical protein
MKTVIFLLGFVVVFAGCRDSSYEAMKGKWITDDASIRMEIRDSGYLHPVRVMMSDGSVSNYIFEEKDGELRGRTVDDTVYLRYDDRTGYIDANGVQFRKVDGDK